MSALLDLGRTIEAVEAAHASLDSGGSLEGDGSEDQRERRMRALHFGRMGLYEAACEYRAETPADAIVQLAAAFIVADVTELDISTSREDVTRNFARLRSAIASALSILLQEQHDAAIPLRGSALDSVKIAFRERGAAPG